MSVTQTKNESITPMSYCIKLETAGKRSETAEPEKLGEAPHTLTKSKTISSITCASRLEFSRATAQPGRARPRLFVKSEGGAMRHGYAGTRTVSVLYCNPNPNPNPNPGYAGIPFPTRRRARRSG